MQTQYRYSALVVDDEVPLVRMQTSFLADIGIKAEGAYSGAEAILYLQSNEVDLVISDVRMPGTVDGITLYGWVGQYRPSLLKRFFFVSGDMVGISDNDFFLTSTVPRLQKPFLWDDYSGLIEQLLGHGAEVL